MSDDGIKIREASQVGITAMHNTMIINDYKGTVGLRHNIIEVDSTSTYPKTKLNKSQVQFNFSTGDCAINIPQSYITQPVTLTYHFKEPAIVKLMNGTWWKKGYITKQKTAVGAPFLETAAGTTMTGKKPIILDETPIADSTAPFELESEWKAVTTGPLCSPQILNMSDLKYNGLNVHTPNIDEKIKYYVAKVNRQAALANPDVWFKGDVEKDDGFIQIDGRPYYMNNGVKTWWGAVKLAATDKPAAAEFTQWTTGADFQVTRTFNIRIPLCFTSDVFLQENSLFYTNAVNASWMQLYMNYAEWEVHHLFGKRTTATGDWGLIGTSFIDKPQLHIYEKRSGLFTSDLSGGKNIPSKTLGCAPVRLCSTGANYGKQTLTIHESKRSVNDIMFTIRPDDQHEDDSCYVHGLVTTNKAAEIVKQINDKSFQAPINQFYDFNMTFPSSGNLLFQPQGITELSKFRNVTLGSMGLLDNFYAQPSPLMENRMWNLLFSPLIINLESFRGDFLGRDVILDGVDTNSKGPTVSFSIYKYNVLNKDNPVMSTQTNDGYTTLGSLIVDSYLFYDAWNIVLPQQNKMVFTEEPEKYK